MGGQGVNYQMFKEEALRNHCRECLNRIYRLALERRDCLYLPYPEQCSACGEIRNIVADISRSKRWRVWLYRPTGSERRGEN